MFNSYVSHYQRVYMGFVELRFFESHFNFRFCQANIPKKIPCHGPHTPWPWPPWQDNGDAERSERSPSEASEFSGVVMEPMKSIAERKLIDMKHLEVG